MSQPEERGQKRKRSRRTQKKIRRRKRRLMPARLRIGGIQSGATTTVDEAPMRRVNYGESYWANYKRALLWQQSYTEGMWKQRALQLVQENDQLRRKLSSLISDDEEDEDSDEDEGDTDELSEDRNSSSLMSETGEVTGVEVTEEFLHLIQSSLRNKATAVKKKKKSKKREKRKRKAKAAVNTSSTATATSDTDSSTVAAGWSQKIESAPEGTRIRSEGMALLYGAEAPKIHGMETAMHLTFLRKCDKTKPILWPVLPLSSTASVKKTETAVDISSAQNISSASHTVSKIDDG